MRILKRIFLSILLLILLLATYIYFSMRANIPESQIELAAASNTANSGAPVLIFGATRNTGLELAKLLHARGEKVVAFARSSSNVSDLNALDAEILIGDATDLPSIEAAMATQSFRAVVTTVGCFSCDPPIDFTANKNIIDAAKAANIPTVLFISTIGAGDSLDAMPFISKKVLGHLLPLKTQTEDYLAASGLDFIIIRPGGLGYDPVTGTGLLSEDPTAFGYIDRSELSQLMLKCLDQNTCTNKTLSALDAQKTLPW